MSLLILAAIALAVLVYVGRGARSLRVDRRLWPALGALAAAAGAFAVGFRGLWVLSLLLIALSLWLARATSIVPTSSIRLSPEEARAILGVGPDAERTEIQAAYRRLMLRAHPDLGGTAGLAAQINAARDRLLKKN